MKKLPTIFSIFDKFQRIPKGILIDAPNKMIQEGFFVSGSKAFFTRRTLKHLAEKGMEGKRLFLAIPIILKNPDYILKGDGRRFLFVKYFRFSEDEPYVIVVECVSLNMFIIITTFVSNKKYLKNFKILWRTGTSLS